MATKEKTQEKNGTAPEKEPMDLAAMREQMNEAERLADERFIIEYQRLCEYHRRRVRMVPSGLNSDNSIRWMEAVERL